MEDKVALLQKKIDELETWKNFMKPVYQFLKDK